MNSAFSRALILTILFCLSLSLVGQISFHQSDPLSLWLVESLALEGSQGFTPLPTPSTATASSSFAMLSGLLGWVLSFLNGVLTLLIFDRLSVSRASAAASGLLFVFLGLVILLFTSTGLLISTIIPVLSIAFALAAGFTLLGSPPMDSNGLSAEKPPRPEEPGTPEGPSDKSASGDQISSNRRYNDLARSHDAEGNGSLTATSVAIGRYEIIRTIGKGAMGEVFLGRDPHINRLTAIKTVHFEDTFGSEDIQHIKGKFFREAESAGTLSHPNIVTIYDAGEDGDSAYIAMEFLEGSTLLRFTRRKRLLPLRRFIRYMVQVAEALEYAHSQGVIHRDIKPANIILMQSDQIKITDFGIAHLATSSQTQTGVVKGTPYYMSPEQFSGQKVDGRSDIFSLGTTMFQLLTGTLPFYAESPALLMNQIMNFPHPNPRALNFRIIPAMVGIIDRTLAKDRDSRYQSAKALAKDLRRLDGRIKAVLRKEHMRPS